MHHSLGCHLPQGSMITTLTWTTQREFVIYLTFPWILCREPWLRNLYCHSYSACWTITYRLVPCMWVKAFGWNTCVNYFSCLTMLHFGLLVVASRIIHGENRFPPLSLHASRKEYGEVFFEALWPYQELEFKRDRHSCWIADFICSDQAIPASAWHWSSWH